MAYNLHKMLSGAMILIPFPPPKSEAAATPKPRPVDPVAAPASNSPLPARKPGDPNFEDHYPECKIPNGFQPPVDKPPGEEFTALATCKIKDGILCVLALDGCPLEEDEEPEVIKGDENLLETLRQVLPATGLPY